MEEPLEISYPYITQSDNNWVYENVAKCLAITLLDCKTLVSI